MADHDEYYYGACTVNAIGRWMWARSAVESATTAQQFAGAFVRLAATRAALAACPTTGTDKRHQHAMLVLIDDTVLWATAKRDGGDVAAARRDMDEAFISACAEGIRRSEDVQRRRQGAEY